MRKESCAYIYGHKNMDIWISLYIGSVTMKAKVLLFTSESV